MEADITVELHTNTGNGGIVYYMLIGDIRKNVNLNSEKYSDISHIKRLITQWLEEFL